MHPGMQEPAVATDVGIAEPEALRLVPGTSVIFRMAGYSRILQRKEKEPCNA